MSFKSRRDFLGSGAVLAVGGLAGCSLPSPAPDDEEELGPTYTKIEGITIKPAPDEYSQQSKYIAALSSDLVSEYSIGDRNQCRIRLKGAPETNWGLRPVLYTVKTDHFFAQDEEKTVWLTEEGLRRIKTGIGTSKGQLFLFGAHPNLKTKSEATTQNEYIEQTLSNGTTFLCCAPNGGSIEEMTDIQAIRTASETGQSAWTTAGYDDEGRATERWKMDPTLVHIDSYKRLSRVYYENTRNGFDYSLSFRELDSERDDVIILSGLIREEFQERTQSQLRDALPNNVTVTINYRGKYSGIDTLNVVNRTTTDRTSGLQILQSRNVIDTYWRDVSEAMQSIIDDTE